MQYERISEITNIQIIASGKGVDIRAFLSRKFGRGKWRKLKGNALVKYDNGEIWLVELHWYEAHGIGKQLEKVKYKLERQI
jgi:hypothetical protein